MKLALLLSFVAAPAFAQSEPTFQFSKPAPVADDVQWVAQLKGGGVISAGNSQATNASLGGNAACIFGSNKLSLDATVAYGESNNRVYAPANAGDPTVIDSPDDIVREQVVATNNALGKLRYDRNLDDTDALYALIAAGQDRIAGKELFGGGQIGYSLTVFSNDSHKLLAELGYDLSDEVYFDPDAADVLIHSARIHVGELWTLTKDTAFFADAEFLANLNKETNALDARFSKPTLGVDSFRDLRVNAKLGITAGLTRGLTFAFSVGLKYDQNPAPLSPTPAFSADYRAFAQSVDFVTDASIIVTLL